MLQAIRARINATSVLIALALVFAMTGGAYAAKKYLITSTKQISPGVLKALQGKTGANGAQGPAGPGGPQGPAGANGTNGGPGSPGGSGESVTSAALAKGDKTCPEGGSKFTVGGKETFACGGKEGKEGKPGQTGFTETLPSEQTETGVYTFELSVAGNTFQPISFSIPLEKEPKEALFVTAAEQAGTPPAGCKGSPEHPTAAPGTLCVYASKSSFGGAEFGAFLKPSKDEILTSGVGTTGTIAKFECSAFCLEDGSWAVTAE